jgi:SpoVK/Ycf46/Vps4 family AAA+-type ATPase
MLNLPSVKDNLVQYINAGFPILYINTFEEAKVDECIAAIAGRKEVVEWNGADGFVDFKHKKSLISSLQLEDTLAHLKSGKELNRKLLVIKDADEILKTKDAENKVVCQLKEIARKIRIGAIDSTVIIISPVIRIPQALEKMTAVLALDLPKKDDIEAIIKEFIEVNGYTVNEKLFSDMLIAFKGLSEFEIRNLLGLAIQYNAELTDKTLELIESQQQQMILKEGLLEIVSLKEGIEDIGGLENLKEWLKAKSRVFNVPAAKEFGVPTPKGVLITGLPGCGKSLTAKAAGKLFGVPLIKLDMGRIMGKYVGESEENMRKAIRSAEAMSPCVLWIDELEKAFAGVKGDSGSEVTIRLFGTILTWMQEKTSPVFVLATANKIKGLPPELLRKGRFDEVFYVPLPNDTERRAIFDIHVKKLPPNSVGQINLDVLVSETKGRGFCGADIEGVVGESVESVFVKEKTLTTDDILGCIRKTCPLSEVMSDELKEMEEEYSKRKLKPASWKEKRHG